MLQLIRDDAYLDDRNINSFIRALTKEGKRRGVNIEIKTIHKDIEMFDLNLTKPTLITKPFDYILPEDEGFNDVDKHSTATVCYDKVVELSENKRFRDVLVINRSELIGKPLMQMLLNDGFRVSMCHSKTDNDTFYRLVDEADIIVSATGKDLTNKIQTSLKYSMIIDVSNDLKALKDTCWKYISMSEIGKLTVQKIIDRCKEEM